MKTAADLESTLGAKDMGEIHEGHIAEVIEYSYANPSKSMVIAAGVEVSTGENVISGGEFKHGVRLSLREYKEMNSKQTL
jgi:hypothetical protein